MMRKRLQWSLIAGLAAIAVSTSSFAQITGELVNPNVMLVIDSSGSMDWLQDHPPGATASWNQAAAACASQDPNQRTSWQKLVDVMLGSIPADEYHCQVEAPEIRPGLDDDTVASDVLHNIRGLNETKTELNSLTPALGIEFVALQSNVAELAHLTGLASRLGAARVLVSNVLAYTDEMRGEILYGYEPRSPLGAGGWPVRAGAWVMFGTLDLPRMHWGAEQRCRFVHDRAAVIGWDGSVVPCYALSHNYDYLAIDGRRKQVTRYVLGNVTQQALTEVWTSEEYCRFRNQVSAFFFPSCPDCDLRESCDLRERNEGCWGWNPSCADCLWAQEIIRCP